MSDRLAIEGGPKTVTQALPGVLSAEGRTFDGEEEKLVLEALRSGCLSRNGGTMVRRLEQEFATALGAEYGRQKYAPGLCPGAENALSQVIAIQWNENFTDEHVRQIAEAIRKVAHHLSLAAAR